VALAWFHCFSGIAGDLALGALLDAGADVDEVRDVIARLPVSGWDLRAEVVQRAGLRATRAVVHAPEDPDHHRTFSDLRGLLAGADLPDRVRARALSVFTALAEAEGPPPRRAGGASSFHEVGASTPSSTSSGRAPRSSCSTSTRSARVRSRSASARCGPPTASCPTLRRRRSPSSPRPGYP
jgi:hypothetical protein